MQCTVRPFLAAFLWASIVWQPCLPARADDPAAKNPADPQPAVVEQLGEEACQAVAQFYAYDRTIPLEARLVEKRDRDGYVREKIVFRGAQGFLVPAYLQLPTTGEAPFACVLLLHGWSGSKENWWQDDNYISGGNARQALLDAGYAVFALDAQCHGDRIAQNDFAPVNHYTEKDGPPDQRKGYFTLPEIYIQTTRDYRRAIDYLETRADIDAKRIAAWGYSMGGHQTYLLTGVEPRLRASVACAAPSIREKWSPVAPQNFLRTFGERPFLELMGRSDPLCPLDQALGRFALLNDPAKQQILFDSGHKMPVEHVARGVEWLKARFPANAPAK